MDEEENRAANRSNEDQEAYEILEEELDLHVPIVGENNNNPEDEEVIGGPARLVPNGLHGEDESTTEEEEEGDDLIDEEVPLQPRIMLGGIMAFLGQHRVDDSSSDDDDDENVGNREEFDSELPGQHSYLGEGRELGGRTILEDDTNISLPLLNQPGLALVPGQLLPLHLFHPAIISMMRKVIHSTKTFGVVSLKADSSSWAGLVGTTAEIFEYQEEEEEAVGLKVKARGRQRFEVVSSRRQVDGNLVGEVRMLVDRELPEPISMFRLRSTDKFQTVSGDCPRPSSCSPDDQETKSCFSFLSRRKPESLQSVCGPQQRRRPRREVGWALSPLPSWVWQLYSPSNLVTRVRQELSNLSSVSTNMSAVPSDPTELSWWVTANLPLPDSLRSRMLGLNSPVQRLRLAVSFLSQCRVLVCRNCGKQLGDQASIFSMSKEGPQGAFVNPSGHLHETLTLFKAKNLRLVGRPSTEYSWFPGYAWTITECQGCWGHIGWKFTATHSKLTPAKFYGFSRKNIEAKVDVPDSDTDEEPVEKRKQSDMIM